jgi:hypothetical protein
MVLLSSLPDENRMTKIAWKKIQGIRLLLATVVFMACNTALMTGYILPYLVLGWQPWRMQVAPLMTEWATEIDPNKVLPEYPRPQLARADWLNLNGIWEYRPGSPGDAVPAGFALGDKILVPFCVESAISGVMERHDRLWYRRTFEIPASWAGKHVLLHFGAVDWEAEVFVNGATVGLHRGGYDPFSFDVTAHLHGGVNELIVRVYDPTDAGEQPRGKQSSMPDGIFYTSATGIWQTVWLEPVPETCITDITLVPDVDNDRLNVTILVTGKDSGIVTVEATAWNGSNPVGQASGAGNASFLLPVPDTRLWSPADPFLYNLTLVVKNGSETVDSVDSYFGMRKVSRVLVGSQYKMFLNDQFTFQFGPLDQGFWPDGIYTAPSDAALKWDIEKTKELGFNMTRKHVKVEPDRWYYWCDKLGLLVWQDMPAGDNGDATGQANFEHELRRMVACRQNHPSIVTWIVFNEGWGQHDTIRLTQLMKKLDPSRIVSCASGWNDFEVGDVRDSHSYPLPSCPPSTTRVMVNGEFGGIGWLVDGHYWTAESWGYVSATSQAQYMALYTDYASQVKSLAESEGLSAAVYTQLTDVEMEVNGLITYDRRVIKPDVSQIRGANQFSITPVSYRGVMNSSQLSGQAWNYTTASPGTGWNDLVFDDSGWATSTGGFGKAFTPGSMVRTTWDSSDIWLRKYFNPGAINSTQRSNLTFKIHHDEDVDVYINGVLAYSATGYTSSYITTAINQAAKDAIVVSGTNVIAVHCHQTVGGQYVDVGIYERVAA